MAVNFDKVLASPDATYSEGRRFFRGKGMLNAALKKIDVDLQLEGIDFVVIGAIALNRDGLPKPVAFPDPADVAVVIDGVKTIVLEKLIELKLASGMTASDRLKDLADVQELIKIKKLDETFAEQLDEYVRAKFLELHAGVVNAKGGPGSED